MLEDYRLIDLGQDLVLVLGGGVVYLGSWFLQLQLRVAYHLLNDLLLHLGLTIGTYEFNGVTKSEVFREQRTSDPLYCNLILKLNESAPNLSYVLRSLDGHRLGPAEDGAEDGAPEGLGKVKRWLAKIFFGKLYINS